MKFRFSFALVAISIFALGYFTPAFAAVPVSVNPGPDLAARENIPLDSWYFCGRLNAENGDEYNYVVHHLKVDVGEGKPQFAWRQIALTNITKGLYSADHNIYPLSEMSASKTVFDVRVPGSSMSGDMQELVLTTSAQKGGVDLVMHPLGPVMYYNGGQFPWLDTTIWEYAFPKMETTGTVTFGGETLKVTGTSFFDRQWDGVSPVMLGNDFKWTWMAITLDNGHIVTVWDILHEGKESAFATILNPGGAITTAEIVPLGNKADQVWVSPDSGRKYPNHWVVEIPSLDISLEVTTTKPGQEVLSESACKRPQGCMNPDNGLQHNYQSAATVKGTFQGEKVTGFSHMEHVGGW
jgi:predicted secreted hydrolase